jgi:hypothetical protein
MTPNPAARLLSLVVRRRRRRCGLSALEDDDALVEDMRLSIRAQVSAGFATAEQIVESALEEFGGGSNPVVLRPLIERVTAECLREHSRAQSRWPAPTDCDRLDGALAELEEREVVCRQHFGDASGSEIRILEEVERLWGTGRRARGFCYYPVEAIQWAVEGGTLLLHHGAVRGQDQGWPEFGAMAENERLGREIVETLKRHGLRVEWTGKDEDCIQVRLEWKRRR